MPITDPNQRPTMVQDQKNPNIWYKTKVGGGNKTEIVFDENGNFINIYKLDDGTDNYTSKVYWEGDEKLYSYGIYRGDIWEVRVDCQAFYTYEHTQVFKDGITEPLHIFGADAYGRDIFARLTSGARFSFILAIIVASVNLFVGAIYGAIEGYYGGKIDIVMERFVELLSSIPFMIVITLLKYHLDVSHMLVLFISFFLTGWTGMAARTRMQFYRFKNQEYVLVARTLGARDRRIMFKHIFPNAIGTLITGSVLVIPGVIFSETSLSYLNIIDLNTGSLTSVGTLLAAGQNALQTHPHIILFPAVFISLLMLSFNLFGNGLRDAFNPSLRGTED
jgi:oligopeptide transport system permease protein